MEFNEELIQQVWEKGRGMPEQDAIVWRKDECGAWIRHGHFGNENSEFGWKIVNVSVGGPNVLENLQPFHLKNSYDRGNGQPQCHISEDRTGIQPTAQIDTPHNKPT